MWQITKYESWGIVAWKRNDVDDNQEYLYYLLDGWDWKIFREEYLIAWNRHRDNSYRFATAEEFHMDECPPLKEWR